MSNKKELNDQIDKLMSHGIEVLNAIAGIAEVLAASPDSPEPARKRKAKKENPDPSPAAGLPEKTPGTENPPDTETESAPAPVPPEQVPEESKTPPSATPAPAAYTKEDVRKVLAEKAAEDGGKYRAEVKFLVKKYGKGGSLKDVNPEDYAALVAEAEALGNG